MPPNAATPRQPPSDQDPDASFRARMREDLGIDPGSIIWDNKPHRFPGKDKKRRNDAGWYVAFPDRTGGVFGDHSQVCPEKGITWQMKRDKPPTAEERAEWARQDAERLERAKARQAAAAIEARAAWDAAVPATSAHPYLKAKRVTRHFKGVKVLPRGTPDLIMLGKPWEPKEDILLVPMGKPEAGIVNVQRIHEDGRKRHWPGAEVSGTFCLVGKKRFGKDKSRIYLCEGWVTGWSIAGCASAPVFVAFSTSGLLPVGQHLRKRFPDARIIMAADNDRWTKVHDGTPNPGVWYARQVVAECRAELAIPEFKDLSEKPSDFNDLHRLEGPKAVRKWLDPKQAKHAVTVPADEAQPEEAPAEEAEGSIFEQWNELENLSDWIANGIIAAMPGLAAVYNEAKVVGWNQYTEELGWTQTAHHDLLRRAYHIVRSVSTPRQKYGPVEADGITVLSRKRRVRATVQGDWNASEAYLPLQGSPRGVELRTGKVVTVPAEELMTHRVNVSEKSYRSGEDWRGGFWEECLYQWLDDDPDTIQTIQQTLGQALIGNPAQRFMFVYGSGKNGKTLFVEALEYALGDFAGRMNIDYIVKKSKHPMHPEGLQVIEGRRLVISGEVPARPPAWNEELLKNITGGDSMTVRGMRQNSRTIVPRTLLVSYGNSQPKLDDVGASMKRRLTLIPFTKIVPEDKLVDFQTMTRKLKKARGEVLGSMLDGLGQFLQNGSRIEISDRVRRKSREYIESEDALTQTLFDVCERKASEDSIDVATLYARLKQTIRKDEITELGWLTKIKMGKELVNRGFRKAKGPAGDMRIYGLGFKDPAP